MTPKKTPTTAALRKLAKHLQIGGLANDIRFAQAGSVTVYAPTRRAAMTGLFAALSALPDKPKGAK